jgi:hypothetical protein
LFHPLPSQICSGIGWLGLIRKIDHKSELVHVLYYGIYGTSTVIVYIFNNAKTIEFMQVIPLATLDPYVVKPATNEEAR